MKSEHTAKTVEMQALRSTCSLPRVSVGAKASTSSVRALVAPAARPVLRATLASRPARLGACPSRPRGVNAYGLR